MLKKINIPEGVIFNIVEDNNYIYLNYNNVKTKFRKHLKDKISDIYKVLSFLNKNNVTKKNLTDLYDLVFGTYPIKFLLCYLLRFFFDCDQKYIEPIKNKIKKDFIKVNKTATNNNPFLPRSK
jgi:hypothetical protein